MVDRTARLFAALEVPVAVAQELAAWARQVARASGAREPGWLRVLAPASIHLTLVFLGERPLSEVEMLAQALREGAEPCEPCEVRLGAPLWLPPRRPRTLAVEAHEATGALARLQRSLAGTLGRACAQETGRERFRAHVTVARMRAQGRIHGELPVTPALGFRASEAVLYRSRLEPEGARYERLASAALRGPTA